MSAISIETAPQTHSPQGRSHAIAQKLRSFNFLHRKNYADSAPENTAILPERVRFAMRYNGAQLRYWDVRALHDAGFSRASFYLAMKGVKHEPAHQIDLITRLASVDFDYSKLTEKDITPALMEMTATPPTGSVSGEKLGQFSRHGFATEVNTFDRALGAAVEANPNATVFGIAHYPFIGFDVLAKHSLARGMGLGVINPDNIGQPEARVGYLMEQGQNGLNFSFIREPSQLPREAIFFDDSVRHGKTQTSVLAWAGQASVASTFVTANQVPSETVF